MTANRIIAFSSNPNEIWIEHEDGTKQLVDAVQLVEQTYSSTDPQMEFVAVPGRETEAMEQAKILFRCLTGRTPKPPATFTLTAEEDNYPWTR